jgi:hypothetical protein
MKRLINVTLATALLLLPMTAFAQKVVTDNDPKAPFASYKTYGWGTGTPAANPFGEKRIHDGVDERMAKAGFKQVEANPDVIVATHAVTKEEKELSASGYRGGLRWGGMGTASVATYTYTVGSLVVDLYDAKTKALVWRGAATDSLDEKPEKNAEKIVKALDKLFKAYPPKVKK